MGTEDGTMHSHAIHLNGFLIDIHKVVSVSLHGKSRLVLPFDNNCMPSENLTLSLRRRNISIDFLTLGISISGASTSAGRKYAEGTRAECSLASPFRVPADFVNKERNKLSHFSRGDRPAGRPSLQGGGGRSPRNPSAADKSKAAGWGGRGRTPNPTRTLGRRSFGATGD